MRKININYIARIEIELKKNEIIFINQNFNDKGLYNELIIDDNDDKNEN